MSSSHDDGAAPIASDPYAFDAPQYYDFGREAEEQENDPPVALPAAAGVPVVGAAAAVINKQQPEAGGEAALLMSKGMGSLSLSSSAGIPATESQQPSQKEQELTAAAASKVRFGAPSDLMDSIG